MNFHLLRRTIIGCVYLYIALSAPAQQYLFKKLDVTNGLPSDYITQIVFDHAGLMWIGTDKGLCVYDGANTSLLTTDNGLPTNMIAALLEDKNHDMWAANGEAGISKIQLVHGKPKVVKTLKHPFSVRTISQDTSGYFWIKTINRKTCHLWRTEHPEKKWTLIAELKDMRSADVTENGVLYYLADQIKFAGNSRLTTKLLYPSSLHDTAALYASHAKVALLSSNKTTVFDDNGNVYDLLLPGNKAIGNYGYYLSDGSRDVFYRTRVGSFIFEKGVYTNKICLAAGSNTKDLFFTIAADSYHRLYISHFGYGILEWKNPYVIKYDLQEKIGRIHSTADGIVFNAGNTVYDFNYKDISNKPIFHSTRLQAVSGDASGLPLIVTNDTIHFSAGEFSERSGPILDISDVHFLKGAYYVTSYSTGIHRIINGKADRSWATLLTGPGLERMKEFDGNLYVTTLSKGVYIVNPATRQVNNINQQNGLISNAVFEVYKEADSLWVGSNKGICKIIHDATPIKFDASSGFIGSKAICIFRDQQERMWVLSDKMLHLLLNDTLIAIRSHPILTNDESLYINTAWYDKRVDKLWAGTNEHLLGINMQQIIPEHETYPLSVGSVLIDSELVQATDKHLQVAKQSSQVEIHFLNPHISAYSKPAFYYRLVGYNDAWQLINQQQVISFQQLPAGNYTLQTKSVGPDFGFNENEEQLLITVMQPWYFRSWFIALVLLIAIVCAFLISRMIAKRKYEARHKKMQAEQALEMERMRISRELHDNVGSMLTVVINKLEDSPTISGTEQQNVVGIARKTLSQLRDAIWALDKSNLSMGEWVSRLQQYLQQVQPTNISIQCSFQLPADRIISPIKALHSFRIIQEIITNAIRHSGAQEISLNGYVNQQEEYEIMIHDNGKGFDEPHIKKGYGIRNMQKRAVEIAGNIRFESVLNKGTTIWLQWPA